MKFTICEKCGANLDPGEACECTKKSPSEKRTSTKESVIIKKSVPQHARTLTKAYLL